MSSRLLLYLFIHGFTLTFFNSEQHCFYFITDSSHVVQTFQTYWVYSSTQSSLVIQNSCYTDDPLLFLPSCTSVLSQLSSLTIVYFILGVKSCPPKFLLAMSHNYRPPSHQSILCILKFSPFLTKCILLAMCLMCLV